MSSHAHPARGAVPAVVLTISLASLGCSATTGAGNATGTDNEPLPGTLVDLVSPAAPGSGEPNLFAAADGRVYMSWIEPSGAGHTIRFAALYGSEWSEPRTIAKSEELFVNWADFPSIVATGKDRLAVHWLQKSGPDTYAYDVRISRSVDGGKTWSESVIPHRDDTRTEHGFVSLVPEADGGFTAVWLDGRNFADRDAGTSPEMTLRGARFDAAGLEGPEALLDPRICDCCQTSAAYLGDNLVVAYRDRSADEIRDIYSVRRTADGWQEPVRVSHDDWQIPGCPVNGPAVAANENAGAIAWFSLRNGNPEVKVTFTRDGVATFSEPILLDGVEMSDVDAGDPRQVARMSDASSEEVLIPLGRVDAEWVNAHRVAVIWLVARGNAADIVLQTVDLDGNPGRRYTLVTTGSMRASGFPRIVGNGNRLVMAWTEPGEPATLHTAIIGLPLE